jgi:hypothetical protein
MHTSRALVLAFVSSACVVDVPPLDNAQSFRCNTTDDCAEGYQCLSGYCGRAGTSCGSHFDCGVNEACVSAHCTGACTNGSCSPGMICRPNHNQPQGFECASCTADNDCPNNTGCATHADGTNRCEPRCGGTQSCPTGALCVSVAGPANDPQTCVACPQCQGSTVCADAPDIQVYEQSTTCTGTCANFSDCTDPELPACNNGVCSECAGDGDCDPSRAPGRPHCELSNGTCVQCLDNSHCASGACNADHQCFDPSQCNVQGCPGNDACATRDAAGNLDCRPSCTSATDCPNGACITVDGWVANTSTSVQVCKPCDAGCGSCEVETATFNIDDTELICTAGGTCNCVAPELCVDSGEGPYVCRLGCAAAGSACTDTGGGAGTCTQLPHPESGAPELVCLSCETCGSCMIYGTGFSNEALALRARECTCAPEANPDWYSLGMSACGGGVSTIGVSQPGPSISMRDGDVAVGYTTNDGPRAHVYRFRPTDGWQAVGDSGDGYVRTLQDGNGASQGPEVGLENGGSVRVGWVEANGYQQIYSASGGGGSWLGDMVSGGTQSSNYGFGLSQTSSANHSNVSLAVLGDAMAMVWMRNGQSWHAAERVSGTWRYMPDNNGFSGYRPKIAITGDGRAYVAYESTSSVTTSRPFLAAWDPTTTRWNSLDGSQANNGVANSGEGVQAVDVRANGALEPVVLWQSWTSTTTDIRIRQHVPGNGWVGYPTTQTIPDVVDGNPAMEPALALASDGRPYVAYNYNWRIRVRHEEGGSFRPFLAVDDTDGISLPSFNAGTPRLAIGPSPRDLSREAVCVAWLQDTGSGVSQVYLRCHDL